MKITVLCVGKIKEKFYVQAIDEFRKRLSRYCSLQILEAADEKTPEGASEILLEQIREKEGSRLLAMLPEDSYVIALAIDWQSIFSHWPAAAGAI